MAHRAVIVVLAVVLAFGLSACGGEEQLTAPDGSAYLELTDQSLWVSGVSRSDGPDVWSNETVQVIAKFHGRGEQEIKDPLYAWVWFRFEDGGRYDNMAMSFGPFTGYRFEINARFRISDGLLAAARTKPGQRVQIMVQFDNGPSRLGQVFPLQSIYIKG